MRILASRISIAAVALGGLLFAGAANANPVSVRNDTGKDLKFHMKCTGPNVSAWTEFVSGPGVVRTLNFPRCQNYLFEMTTTHRRTGARIEVRHNWPGGTNHSLVWNDSKGAFDSRRL